jgi:hypothetical protein
MKWVPQRQEPTSTSKRVAHCGLALSPKDNPRTASHPAVKAVRVDPAHPRPAVAASHSGRCPKRVALAPRRQTEHRTKEGCGGGPYQPGR